MAIKADDRMVRAVSVPLGDGEGKAIPLDNGRVLVASRTRDAWHLVSTVGRGYCTCEWWQVHRECAHFEAALTVAVGRRMMKPEFVIERQGKQAVLYAGLIDQAHAEGLKMIITQLLQTPTSENGHTAIVHAHVETDKGVFEGLGDASPGNVTKMIAGHIIRMAETRAKARALRDAINVGTVAVEELEDEDEDDAAAQRPAQQSPRQTAPAQNGQRPAPASEQPKSDNPLCPIHNVPTRTSMSGNGLGHDLGGGAQRGWCDLGQACAASLSELMATYSVTLADLDKVMVAAPSIGKGWIDLTTAQRARVLPKLWEGMAKKKATDVGAEPAGVA